MGRKKTNNVYNFFQYDAMTNISKCMAGGNCTVSVKGKHGSNLLKHMAKKHNELYNEIIKMNAEGVQITNTSLFETVKQLCFQLVSKHGRPLSLFDDAAFQDLLKLILPESKVEKLNARNMLQILKEKKSKIGLQADTEVEDNGNITRKRTYHRLESLNSTEETLEEPTAAIVIKGEVTQLPHSPEPAQRPYWDLFNVSVDMATCLLCEERIAWTTIGILKEHLIKAHPSVEFKDDDKEFETHAQDTRSLTSFEDMEEVYLEETKSSDASKDMMASPSKKRKMSSLTEIKQMSVERKRSLDRFGLYVSSLLSFIPLNKCVKFQGQIIQRLLQEQSIDS